MEIDTSPECCICLMPIKYGKPAWKVRALRCGHVFHLRCITQWSRKCPECRDGEPWLNAVDIDVELYTNIYRRCFKVKILRTDEINLLFIFIKEITKIGARHLQLTTFEVKNNIIDIVRDPPKPNETLQTYCNRRESVINILVGFATLYHMKIRLDIITELKDKINANPGKYHFTPIKDAFIPIELDESEDETSSGSIQFVNTPTLCGCCIV
jgi:hypothetical protein